MANWADLKAQARASAHAAFGVPCTYQDTASSTPVDLTARLHSKSLVGGNAGLGSGYAQIVEGVERVIFDKRELAAKGVVLHRNGRVTFAVYGSDFLLGEQDDNEGPVNERWTLSGR